MKGRIVTRYCKNCEKEVHTFKRTGYVINNRIFYDDIRCTICDTDLSKEDREILEYARKTKQFIGKIVG